MSRRGSDIPGVGQGPAESADFSSRFKNFRHARNSAERYRAAIIRDLVELHGRIINSTQSQGYITEADRNFLTAVGSALNAVHAVAGERYQERMQGKDFSRVGKGTAGGVRSEVRTGKQEFLDQLAKLESALNDQAFKQNMGQVIGHFKNFKQAILGIPILDLEELSRAEKVELKRLKEEFSKRLAEERNRIRQVEPPKGKKKGFRTQRFVELPKYHEHKHVEEKRHRETEEERRRLENARRRQLEEARKQEEAKRRREQEQQEYERARQEQQARERREREQRQRAEVDAAQRQVDYGHLGHLMGQLNGLKHSTEALGEILNEKTQDYLEFGIYVSPLLDEIDRLEQDLESAREQMRGVRKYIASSDPRSRQALQTVFRDVQSRLPVFQSRYDVLNAQAADFMAEYSVALRRNAQQRTVGTEQKRKRELEDQERDQELFGSSEFLSNEEELRERERQALAQNDFLAAEIERLQQENDQLQALLAQEREDSRFEKDGLHEQLAVMTKHLMAARTQITGLQEENQGLQNENDEIREHNEKLHALNRDILAELEKLKQDLFGQIETLQEQLQSANQAGQQLAAERDEFEQRLLNVQAELEEESRIRDRAGNVLNRFGLPSNLMLEEEEQQIKVITAWAKGYIDQALAAERDQIRREGKARADAEIAKVRDEARAEIARVQQQAKQQAQQQAQLQAQQLAAAQAQAAQQQANMDLMAGWLLVYKNTHEQNLGMQKKTGPAIVKPAEIQSFVNQYFNQRPPQNPPKNRGMGP